MDLILEAHETFTLFPCSDDDPHDRDYDDTCVYIVVISIVKFNDDGDDDDSYGDNNEHES